MLKKLLPARGVDISSESFTFIIDETDNAVEKIIEQIVVSSFEKLCHEAFCPLTITVHMYTVDISDRQGY